MWVFNPNQKLLVFGSLYFPAPGRLFSSRPWSCPSALVPNLYLPVLVPNCIYRPWPPISIYQPWPTILVPVRGLTLHIPTLSHQFVFVFTSLAHDLLYRSGAWICIYRINGSSSIGSSNSSSSNFFGIDNTNIIISILVNQGKQGC